MKRIMATALVCAMLFSPAACSGKQQETTISESSETTAQATETTTETTEATKASETAETTTAATTAADTIPIRRAIILRITVRLIRSNDRFSHPYFTGC